MRKLDPHLGQDPGTAPCLRSLRVLLQRLVFLVLSSGVSFIFNRRFFPSCSSSLVTKGFSLRALRALRLCGEAFVFGCGYAAFVFKILKLAENSSGG